MNATGSGQISVECSVQSHRRRSIGTAARLLALSTLVAGLSACPQRETTTGTSTSSISSSGGASISSSGGASISSSGGASSSSSGDVGVPPEVTGNSPADGAVNVPAGALLEIAFTQAMDRRTVSVVTTPLVPLGTPMWNASSTQVTFQPPAPFSYNVSYSVAVSGLNDGGEALWPEHVFSFSVEAQADTVPPVVTESFPAEGSTGFSVDGEVLFRFSEAMDPTGVVVELVPAVSPKEGTWTSGNTRLRVRGAFAYSTVYTLGVSGADTAGNVLATPFALQFTTGAAPDVTPPTVTNSNPPDDAQSVPRSVMLGIVFSEPMDTGSVGVRTTPPIALGAASWNATDRSVSFANALLAPAQDYTMEVRGSDRAGNAMVPVSLRFQTATPPDNTPPTVVRTAPRAGANAAPIQTRLQITFSEPMDTASAQAAISGTPAVGPCALTWSPGNRLLTCEPANGLMPGTTYTVTVAESARDEAGNPIDAPFVYTFTTASVGDTARPTVVSSSPANNAVGVASNASIVVTFSEEMDKASAQTAFQVTSGAGNTGLFSWNAAGTEMTYDIPGFGLAAGTQVSWEVTTAAEDLAGNTLPSTVSRTFRTRRESTLTFYQCGTSSACSGGVSGGHMAAGSTCSSALADSSIGAFGDNYANQFLSGFMSFDTSTLGSSAYPNASIRSATLSMRVIGCLGNPFTSTFGSYVDAFSVNYGTVLNATDCNPPVLNGLSSQFGLHDADAYDVRTSASVTEMVSNDLANHAARGYRSQFMVHSRRWATNLDESADECLFLMHSSPNADDRPMLEVTFQYD